MSKPVPTKARAVIIGGGVAGCSVAYHLAKLGWKDVVLLERKQLTSGTTWHAAGLIAQLRATKNMTRLAKYSQELYGTLEEETGVATGFRRCGSITVALTDERKQEILRQASMARAFGVDVEEISAADVKERYPHLNTDDVTGAVYLPLDGQGDPANIALALAKGAKMNGAQVIEGVKVTEIHKDASGNGQRVTGVSWSRDGSDEAGHIEADVVVNCGGMWAHELGRMAGVSVPLHACEHFYIVTEAIEGLTRLPVLRVPDECAYYKEDAGKMLLGAFEPVSKPWASTLKGDYYGQQKGIPDDFCFDQLPEDFDHFEPILENAVNRMPMLGETGIHTFFNGPESFTPDDAYHLGEAPECHGFWVCAGFNSIGIQSSGGAGMALAHWMEHGHPPFDIGDVDIRRMQPFQNNKTYLFERAKESLGLLYADHFPFRQMATARGVRRTPFHEHLKAQGAVFGEVAGWERANWFADEGQEREYEYSWGRQNWFENSKREHEAVRNNVGMYDMSSFGKIRVIGRDAEKFLNRVCGNDVAVPTGKIVYTQFLNERGGIEADVTVTRLSEQEYIVVTPAATVPRELSWMRRHLEDEAVAIVDMTAAEGVLAVMGPNARTLLEKVSHHDWSNDNHPFGQAHEIELGMGTARAHRVTYVGELGWELYMPTDMCAHAFETLMNAGADMDLKLCGMHMMDSLRIEKGYRHFGHDITEEDHVVEAGLGFAVKTAKENFIGRDAVLKKREQGLEMRMTQFKLKDPLPLLYHNEPIIRDGEIVSYVTSANYGHTVGGAIGMGYVPCKSEKPDEMLGSSYEIEIAGERFAAEASLKPMYDPKSERVKV
ncbi:FAD-dependent oxidoreductase [Ahrensia sp. R2A130]|uniref:GcvT family protein n=1 Tax=Ahrensia sp. R2A130 TaxID=744979 RepID=UPI0001E09C48|nr:FAD-dependent oxidoreductase [Ahrensia sp. R2A130]EFL89626.1 sarcosine dehydrogenase [Ahrensia sp. R2A130]